MKPKSRKGQFFLISALIIITILLSFVTYRSRIKVYPVNEKIYNLGEELNLETAQVMDYGIYAEEAQLGMILNSWITNFSAYHQSTGKEVFVFLYTDDEGKTKGIRFSREDAGSVSLSLGGAPIDLKRGQIQQLSLEDFPSERGEITMSVNKTNITFDYNPKEKFYFVIAGEGGEVVQKE